MRKFPYGFTRTIRKDYRNGSGDGFEEGSGNDYGSTTWPGQGYGDGFGNGMGGGYNALNDSYPEHLIQYWK